MFTEKEIAYRADPGVGALKHDRSITEDQIKEGT